MNRPHDTIAYLLLRAWAANPQRYANRIMEYLAADSRRLRVGYRADLSNLVSRKAIECSVLLCTLENRVAVESAIMSLQTEWTPQTPRFRDRTQLDLLESMGETHLGDVARARLLELRSLFPGYKPATSVSTFPLLRTRVVSDCDLDGLSDEALLTAMREQELSGQLDTYVQSQPARYATFAIEKMSDDVPARYFDAILDGISKSYSGNGKATIELDTTVELLRRIHRLPSKPCGRHWAWFIERCPETNWPEDIIDAVAWYAMNDGDPDPNTTGDPEGIGINSTRGSAAYAIAHLLFARRELYSRLKDAIQSLVHDPSLAVRSCAVEVLVAMLNIEYDQAITWFLECVKKDPELLRTHLVFRFLEYGSYRDQKRLRPLLHSMLDETKPDQRVEGAAQVICILGLSHWVGLTNDEAVADVDRIHRGSDVMRKAAAEIYARHVAHKTVGPQARQWLMPFFADSNEAVRIAAAHAFHQLRNLTTEAQAFMLSAFLDSKPTGKALAPLLTELDRSTVELPDLVCKVAEHCIDDWKNPNGERTFAAYHYLPQIVLRLYAQKTDEDIRSRCLNMIDVMERHQVWRLYEELCKAER